MMNGDLGVPREKAAQCGAVLRVKLAAGEAIGRPEKSADDGRRAGIETEFGDQTDIRPQWCWRVIEHRENTIRGFPGARCFRGGEITPARTRVSIKHKKGRGLPAEVLEEGNEEGVLEDVREVASVKGVPIVHLPPVERTG